MDVSSLTLEGLARFLTEELGERAFRAGQVYRWLHQRGVTSFDEMTDLSKALREKLKARAEIVPLVKDAEQRSVDGTIKYRWKTRDGRFIESVYMPSADRKTLCVSTQVGCAMACSFCMTGTLGLKRNLTPGEIVAQVHAVNREVRENERLETLRPLSNLVFMGMGEPLHNFENLKTALSILQSEDGPNFSHRHITVSTVGLVPMIERFGQETDVKLAISLNASTDEQLPQTEAEPKEKEASAPPEAVAKAEAKKERMPRVDWAGLLRRTFVLDVLACAGCGGRRRVLAYVTAPSGVRCILEHLGLPTRPAKLAPAQGPPQSAWC